MSDQPNPGLALAYVRACYTELAAMEVPLDPNPIQYGPKRLNTKVAQARNTLTRCEAIAMEVGERLHWLKRGLLAENALLDYKVKNMMANDPEVRSGRNVSDRESIAHTKLVDDRRKINDLTLAVHDASSLASIVRAKRTDLKDVQGRLRDQRNLCMDEISLGARWGSKLPPDVPDPDLKPGKYVPSDADNVDAIIGVVEGELHLGVAVEATEINVRAVPKAEPEPEPVVAPEPEDDVMDLIVPTAEPKAPETVTPEPVAPVAVDDSMFTADLSGMFASLGDEAPVAAKAEPVVAAPVVAAPVAEPETESERAPPPAADAVKDPVAETPDADPIVFGEAAIDDIVAAVTASTDHHPSEETDGITDGLLSDIVLAPVVGIDPHVPAEEVDIDALLGFI